MDILKTVSALPGFSGKAKTFSISPDYFKPAWILGCRLKTKKLKMVKINGKFTSFKGKNRENPGLYPIFTTYIIPHGYVNVNSFFAFSVSFYRFLTGEKKVQEKRF